MAVQLRGDGVRVGDDGAVLSLKCSETVSVARFKFADTLLNLSAAMLRNAFIFSVVVALNVLKFLKSGEPVEVDGVFVQSRNGVTFGRGCVLSSLRGASKGA